MIRSGRVDLTVLGAMEVNDRGDICQLENTGQNGEGNGWSNGS